MSLLDDIKRSLVKAQPKPQQAQQASAAQAVADVARAATGRAAQPAPVAETPALLAAQQAAKDQRLKVGQQAAMVGAEAEAAQTQADAAASLGQQRLTVQSQQAAADLAAQAQEAGAQRGTAQTLQASQLAAKQAAFANELAHRNTVVLNKLSTDRGITTDQLFAEHREGVQELAFRKDAATLEQKAHVMAMADREYVRNLTQIGEMRRLQNDLNWKAEVQRITLGERLDSMLRGQGYQDILNANERQFNEMMSNMDADTALAILQQQNRDATMAAGMHSAGTAATGIAQNYKGTPATKTASPGEPGSSSPNAGGWQNTYDYSDTTPQGPTENKSYSK